MRGLLHRRPGQEDAVGEARIIQCNLTTQKIKVHFVGWSKNYDLWTDPMSITAHGRYARKLANCVLNLGSRDRDTNILLWLHFVFLHCSPHR